MAPPPRSWQPSATLEDALRDERQREDDEHHNTAEQGEHAN